MGNQGSQLAGTGRVILLDGSIQEFDKPLTVAELMLEYPQQVVVELKRGDPSRPAPLPADRTLDVDKLYLMVPLRRGKPAHLSAQEAHKILLRANEVLRSKALVSSSKLIPFFARMCPVTTHDVYSEYDHNPKGGISAPNLQGGIMDVSNYDELKALEEDDVIERPDHLSRQFSSRGWKPKLDTIEEKKDEIRKGPTVVLLAGKAVKRIESKGLVWG